MKDVELLQATYDEALVRVRRDLGDVAGDARITVDFTDPDGLTYQFETGGAMHGFGLLHTNDAEVATYKLADQIQEDVFETLWSASWPRCPWHDHPVTAKLVDGIASWVCAQSGRVVCPVGQYATAK